MDGNGKPRIAIFDTTLRDGEQAPGFSMREAEKVRLAVKLDELGVDVIEAGFPIASEDDFSGVKAVAKAVRRPVVAALARAVDADVDRALQALDGSARPRLHTFIATSDLHLQHKLHMSRGQALEAAARAVARARRHLDDVEFSAEDATRSDLDYLAAVVTAVVSAGATTVNLPDTVGYATPDEIFRFFSTIRSRVPGADRVTFSAHCHNDLGLAVANSLAAIEAGCRQIECTVNGVGERAGNASLEEIVMALRVRADRLPYTTGICAHQIFSASQLLTEITGEAVQANKAIVGRNAFAHEAGIHQDGILKDRRTYEIMRPEDVGVPKTTMVLGKHSGRHALRERCAALGIVPGRQDLDDLYRRTIALADRQKVVHDRDLVSLWAAMKRAPAARSATLHPHPSAARPAAPARREDAPAEEAGYGYGV